MAGRHRRAAVAGLPRRVALGVSSTLAAAALASPSVQAHAAETAIAGQSRVATGPIPYLAPDKLPVAVLGAVPAARTSQRPALADPLGVQGYQIGVQGLWTVCVDSPTPTPVPYDAALGAQGYQSPDQVIVDCVAPAGVQGFQDGSLTFPGESRSTASASAERQGPQGPQGSEGMPGIDGADGLNGGAGAQGSVGAQGSSGAPGTPGAQGAQGVQGVQGAAGSADGKVGPSGATGMPGPQGFQGTTGAPGPQGVAGSAGPQCATGSQGSTGAQGGAGTPGELSPS